MSTTIERAFKYTDQRPVVYVSGPISALTAFAREMNIRLAEEAGLMLLKMGAAPVVPHTFCRFLGGEYSREQAMESDISQLSRCDGMVTITPDWVDSEGCSDEVAYCEYHEIPVFYMSHKMTAKQYTALEKWLNFLPRRMKDNDSD